MSHVSTDVSKVMEINSMEELRGIINRYTGEGISKLNLVKLVVHWNDGDMQEWTRKILDGRLNTLTMKLGTYQGVEKLQSIYGNLINEAHG